MKKHEKLSSHPFFSKNFETIKPVIEKMGSKMMKRVQKTGKIRNDKIEILENSAYYHVIVFYKASAITSAIERLENSLIYINKFPSPRTYEKKRVFTNFLGLNIITLILLLLTIVYLIWL